MLVHLTHIPYCEGMTPIHLRKIKELRDAKGWSQEELAERAGVRRPTITELENGRGNPTLQTIESIANALGVDASYLIHHERPRR